MNNRRAVPTIHASRKGWVVRFRGKVMLRANDLSSCESFCKGWNEARTKNNKIENLKAEAVRLKKLGQHEKLGAVILELDRLVKDDPVAAIFYSQIEKQ